MPDKMDHFCKFISTSLYHYLNNGKEHSLLQNISPKLYWYLSHLGLTKNNRFTCIEVLFPQIVFTRQLGVAFIRGLHLLQANNDMRVVYSKPFRCLRVYKPTQSMLYNAGFHDGMTGYLDAGHPSLVIPTSNYVIYTVYCTLDLESDLFQIVNDESIDYKSTGKITYSIPL